MGNFDIIFVASARDYHAMDWYRTVRSIMKNKKIAVITDLVESEGVKSILNPNDIILNGGYIDKFLLKKQTKFGNLWRNFIKLLNLFRFALKLKKISNNNRNCIFHAHSMFYVFVCWISGIKFIATPMGSDALVRPFESRVYKFFFIKSIKSASYVTVDSLKMQRVIENLANKESEIIQNGIDVPNSIKYLNKSKKPRNKVISIRALANNYRIFEILNERNQNLKHQKIEFIYPFFEKDYFDMMQKNLIQSDTMHGFLNKVEMRNLFLNTYAVISIPKSDSSPRTVYEAIFLGCVVITTYDLWYETITDCMKKRVVLVNEKKFDWLNKSLKKAKKISKDYFVPSSAACKNFDEFACMKYVCEKYYG